MKFGRSFLMQVAGNHGDNVGPFPFIDISFPITLDFNITHHLFAQANVADFSLYNLSASNRSLISYNQFFKARSYPIILHAGYVSQQDGGLIGAPGSLPVIFNGFAKWAYTERTGPNLVTQINAFDFGDFSTGLPPAYFNDTNKYTAPKLAKFRDIVEQLVSRLSGGVTFGGIFVTDETTIPGPLPREWTFSGGVWTNVMAMANYIKGGGAHAYVENNVCYILSQNAVLPPIGTLESDTGLLGIPRYTDQTINVTSIFEPALKIGAQIELKSSTSRQANGPCKIVAYTHRGTISGVQSGDLISEITLMRLNAKVGAIIQ